MHHNAGFCLSWKLPEKHIDNATDNRSDNHTIPLLDIYTSNSFFKGLISPDAFQSLLALQQNPVPFFLSIFREQF